MTEPTRLTEAELARLLKMAKDHGGNLDVGVQALVEEVRRLRQECADWKLSFETANDIIGKLEARDAS